jgi:urease accessory protein
VAAQTAALAAVREEPAAQAEIVFSTAPDGRTYISRQRVGYPFHITRPFHLDRAPASLLSLYLQSVSGGIYEGERIAMMLTAEPGTQAHVTTQSATVVHRMLNDHAEQHVTIRAGDRAFFEYLPDPVILFPDARLSSTLNVTAAESATVVIAESFAQHDPTDAGGRFARLASEVRVARPDGTLIALDRFDVSGDDVAGVRFGGAANAHPAQGTLMAISTARPADALVNALRAGLDGAEGVYAGASLLPGGCGAWARILATGGGPLRAAMGAAWAALRTELVGAPPGPRRK